MDGGVGVILFARFATPESSGSARRARRTSWNGCGGTLRFSRKHHRDGLVKKTFWFFATIFIFILATNWFGEIPGVGSIGWGHQGEHGFEVTRPLLRGGNADLNMTFAMAMIFFACWIVWAFNSAASKAPSCIFLAPKATAPGSSSI